MEIKLYCCAAVRKAVNQKESQRHRKIGETTMPKRTRSYDSWLLKELTDPLVAANYINAASEDSDEMLLVAVRKVAEAHKMSRVAREANVNRESLYKTLSSEGHPLLESFRNIIGAVGLKLLAVPKDMTIGQLKVETPTSQPGEVVDTAETSGKVLYPGFTGAFYFTLSSGFNYPTTVTTTTASDETTRLCAQGAVAVAAQPLGETHAG
jgi:probable addiction module antidote protein